MDSYKVWIINQEATSPDTGALNRHYNLAKALAKMGHKPVVFAGSSTRHGNASVSNDGSGYTVDTSGGFPFVRIDTADYGESKAKRVLQIVRFHARMDRWSKRFAEKFGAPDVILGSSPYPTAPALAIRIAKRHSAKSICEIRDPWPLDFVVYGIAGRRNPIIMALFALEKHNFKKSDAIIFTMEGGKDYISDRFGAGSPLTRRLQAKTFYVNNGVDLEIYDENANAFHIDLPEHGRKRLVYAGSVRFKNDVGYLIDVAEELQKRNDVELVIAGSGGDLESLKSRVTASNMDNVVFLGQIEKKLIPSLLSQADLLFLHSRFQRDIAKYGMSQNKLFDYLASGKAIVSDLLPSHSIVNGYDCGIEKEFESASECAETVLRMLDSDELDTWGANARKASVDFSFPVLARRLADVMNTIMS